MIICHRYRFIFIKTMKTAGTSVEIGLSGFCGPEDVITPVNRIDERARTTLGHRGPQHYLGPLNSYRSSDWKRLLTTWRLTRRYWQHMQAVGIRRQVGDEVWNSYFKFCFERNPWDKAVSHYYWAVHKPRRYGRRKWNTSTTLADYIRSPRYARTRDFTRYTLNGHVAVDYIGRYEELTEELVHIRNRIGLPADIIVPSTKTDVRTSALHYRELMTDADRCLISKLCAREIALLGYEY